MALDVLETRHQIENKEHSLSTDTLDSFAMRKRVAADDGYESGLRQREKGAAARGKRAEDGGGSAGGGGHNRRSKDIDYPRSQRRATSRTWSSPHPEISLRDVNLLFARFPFSRNNPRASERTNATGCEGWNETDAREGQ